MSIGPFANWWTSQSQNIRTKMNGWYGGFSFCVREAGGGGKGISVVNSSRNGNRRMMGMAAGVISLRCLMNGENTAYTAFIFSCFPSSSFLLLISINCHAYWGDVNALLHTYLVFSKKYRNSANSWFWTSLLDNAPKREIINCLVILCYS